MTLLQNGDDEGALSFDPTNRKQAALAIKVTGARPKRQLSAAHKGKAPGRQPARSIFRGAQGSKWGFEGQNSP
jgi:hypothetical protein